MVGWGLPKSLSNYMIANDILKWTFNCCPQSCPHSCNPTPPLGHFISSNEKWGNLQGKKSGPHNQNQNLIPPPCDQEWLRKIECHKHLTKTRYSNFLIVMECDWDRSETGSQTGSQTGSELGVKLGQRLLPLAGWIETRFRIFSECSVLDFESVQRGLPKTLKSW